MDNKELIEKYPFLLPRQAWTGKVIEDFDYSYNILEISIPEGWWERFGLLWCDDLLNECKKADIDPKNIYITQAKEKYGGLRVYLSGQPQSWFEHEQAWEYISEHTCIKCGKFPVKMRDDGWMCPYCDKHFKEHHPDTEKEFLERWAPKDEHNGKLAEFIGYSSFSDGVETVHKIDMKPYYKLIGWDFKPSDLFNK